MMSVPPPLPRIAAIIPVVEAEPCKPGRKPTGRREEAESVEEEQEIILIDPELPLLLMKGTKLSTAGGAADLCTELRVVFVLFCFFYPQPPVVLVLVRLQHL